MECMECMCPEGWGMREGIGAGAMCGGNGEEHGTAGESGVQEVEGSGDADTVTHAGDCVGCWVGPGGAGNADGGGEAECFGAESGKAGNVLTAAVSASLCACVWVCVCVSGCVCLYVCVGVCSLCVWVWGS